MFKPGDKIIQHTRSDYPEHDFPDTVLTVLNCNEEDVQCIESGDLKHMPKRFKLATFKGNNMSNKETVVVVFHNNKTGLKTEQTFKGREAQTIRALAEAGDKGVTALELSSWALRLAAYVNVLRKAGLDITTVREAHDGGTHGRYILEQPVDLDGVTYFCKLNQAASNA